MPTKKTIEAPEKKQEFTKVTLPLIDPQIGKKVDGQLYISKTAYEKGMEEYLARNDAYAYIYVSEEEYLSIFGPSNEDNAAKTDFLRYASDSRRRIAEVCGATADSIIIKVPDNDPAFLEFIRNSVAILRFYYDSKSKNNTLELKKGTWIHIIEVALIGRRIPEQNTDENKPEEATADATPEVVDQNGNTVTD